MVRFGIPGQNNNPLAYTDTRVSSVPMVQSPRRPTVTDKSFPMWTEWRVNKNASSPAEEGEFWKLVRFESNGDATWIRLSSGNSGPALNFEVDFNTSPGTDPVLPDSNGEISVLGNVVSNATNLNSPVATHSRALNQYQIDVQLSTALAATPGDAFDAGISSYDNQFFTCDSNGFTAIAERLLQYPIGTTVNLGISYSTPTFTLNDSQGNSLSATNPAWVVMPDNSTKGLKKVFTITSNYSFEDDSGTSDLTGNLWGTTTSVAWNQDMPFYIYMVINDDNDEITPMIARHTCARLSASTIGKPSSAVADGENDFWALDDSITVGDYASNPCVRIGVFRMRKNDAPNDDWTVRTINSYDGIGRTAFGVNYIFAVLQNGATARYQSSSGGGDTLPTFNSDGYLYNFEEGGWVNVQYNATTVNNTPSGSGDYRLHLPVQARNSDWNRNFGGFAWTDSSVGVGSIIPGSAYYLSSPSQFVTFRDLPTFGTASTIATPGLFGNGDGNFSFSFRYRGFIP